MTERADAAMYQRVFVGHHEGAKVLEDLTARYFDQPIFVPGGEEGARETQRRAAQHEVIGFILRRIGMANVLDPNDNEPAGPDPLT